MQNEERVRNGDIWHDNDLIFCTEIGTLIDPSDFGREFEKLTRAAGINDWTPYEMHYLAAPALGAMGVRSNRWLICWKMRPLCIGMTSRQRSTLKRISRD